MFAKVRPAIISVRVRLDVEKSLEDNDGHMQQAAPFDRFFRQFRIPDGMPSGTSRAAMP
jgi:hypothetical protein